MGHTRFECGQKKGFLQTSFEPWSGSFEIRISAERKTKIGQYILTGNMNDFTPA